MGGSKARFTRFVKAMFAELDKPELRLAASARDLLRRAWEKEWVGLFEDANLLTHVAGRSTCMLPDVKLAAQFRGLSPWD